MNKLSKRLGVVAKYIYDDSNVIDIGCDHALLDIYLYQNRKNIKIIISDINKEALTSGILNLKKEGLEHKIEARLGNGLDVIKEEDNIDTIVMSGLGSNKMVGILRYDNKKLKNVKYLVLQSNNNLEFLRKRITKLGYYIKDEELVKEANIIYTVILFEKGKKRYNRKEIYFGPILLQKQDALFKEKKTSDLEKLNSLLKIIPKNKYLYRYKIKRKINLYK